jgi:hypothetical protein
MAEKPTQRSYPLWWPDTPLDPHAKEKSCDVGPPGERASPVRPRPVRDLLHRRPVAPDRVLPHRQECIALRQRRHLLRQTGRLRPREGYRRGIDGRSLRAGRTDDGLQRRNAVISGTARIRQPHRHPALHRVRDDQGDRECDRHSLDRLRA